MDKNAKELTTRGRAALADNDFALVYKDPKTGMKVRKYPIHDKEHVINAIQKFTMWSKKINPSQRAKAARKIVRRAKELNVDINTKKLEKYGAELLNYIAYGKLDFEKLSFEIDKRKELIKKIYGEDSKFDKTASEAYDAFLTAIQGDNVDYVKAVDLLYNLDETFKIATDIFYRSKLLPPDRAIFSEKPPTEILYTIPKVGSITASKLYKLASEKEIIEKIKNILGAKFGNRFRDNPVATFEKMDDTYRSILIDIANKADV